MSCLRRARADWPGFFTLKILGILTLSATVCQTSLASDQTTHGQAVDSRSLEALVTQLDQLRTEVESSAQTLGAYNQELLGSLNALTEALISAQAWQEAADTVEQQIQILRINDGLYTEAQIPLIQQQLGILAARGDWSALQERLSYLAFLIDRDTGMPAETRLAHYKQVRDWGRLLLTRGPRTMEARYVLQLQSFEEAALQLAEAEAELNDPDIVQGLIYDRAMAELYMALGIMGTSDTRSQLINRVDGPRPASVRRLQTLTSVSDIESVYGPTTSTVIERAHRTAMTRHQDMIASLATVYGTDDAKDALVTLEQTDPEQAAIIKLFIGDSVLLRQQYELRLGSHTGPSRGSNSTGSAARYYREAWDLLLAAGHSEDHLNAWFACPALLPLDHFSKRLTELPQNCSVSDDGTITLSETAVIRNSIPGLRYDKLPDSDLVSAAEGVGTTLRFTIGMNGQAERIEILSASPDSTSARIRGKQALETLQFRPALRDGRPLRSENIGMTVYSLTSG